MNTIKFNHTLLIILVLSSYTLLGQLKTQGNTNNALTGENAFLDASGNVENGNHFGKGIGFPTTDLTQWEFVTGSADGINFPTTFDGLLVYNTGDGDTKADQGVVTPVEPGFYYFYNPNPAHDKDISKGKWLPVSKGGEAPAGGALMSGAGAPAATAGSAGDVYVDTNTGDTYTKDGTKWVKQDGTDDQKIDRFAINAGNLELSLEGDGETVKTLPLASLGTDDQKIDRFAINAGNLELSLEGDGETVKTLPLASLGDGDAWGVTGEDVASTISRSGSVRLLGHTATEYIEMDHGGNAAYLNWTGDGNLDFRYLGANKMSLSQAGNVGIGTAAATTARLTVDPSGANPTVILGRTNGQPSIKSSGALILDAADGNRADINHYHNGDVSLVNGGGNVGVGTTTPTQKLDVDGGARIRTLTAGAAADEVVVADANGVLKTVSRTALSGTLVTASNGLTKSTSNAIELGGALTKATTITTDATNTLAVTGLTDGDTTTLNYSQVVVDDTTGKLQKVSSKAQYGNIRTHADASPVVWNDDDFVVVITNVAFVSSSLLLLPEANATLTGRILSIRNNATGTVPFADGSATTSGDHPPNYSQLAAGSATMFICDGTDWHPMGGR